MFAIVKSQPKQNELNLCTYVHTDLNVFRYIMRASLKSEIRNITTDVIDNDQKEIRTFNLDNHNFRNKSLN